MVVVEYFDGSSESTGSHLLDPMDEIASSRSKRDAAVCKPTTEIQIPPQKKQKVYFEDDEVEETPKFAKKKPPSSIQTAGGGWGGARASRSWRRPQLPSGVPPSSTKEAGIGGGWEGAGASSWGTSTNANTGWPQAASHLGSPSSTKEASIHGGWGGVGASRWDTSIKNCTGWPQAAPHIVSPSSTKERIDGGWGATKASGRNTVSGTGTAIAPNEKLLSEGFVPPQSSLTFPLPPAVKKSSNSGASHYDPVNCSKPLAIIAQSTHVSFASYMWVHDDRLIVKQLKQLPGTQQEPLEKVIDYFGDRHFLICVKYGKGDGRNLFTSSKFSQKGGHHFDAYYLKPKRPGDSVASELLSILNFQDLSDNKRASRMELLVSAASKSSANQKPRMWLLPYNNFKLDADEDDVHMGCGFIPIKMLEDLAPGASAAQVRIVIPTVGLFKGMLMSKIGIDKIELFHSMKKVDKSLEPPHKRLKGKAFLLFKNVMPSRSASFIDRSLNPHLKNPPPSAEQELKPLCSMFQNLLSAKGVPEDVLGYYMQESGDFGRRNHHSAVGVSDPTNKLPEGSVFVTGLGVGGPNGKDEKVFVTRFPCTEAQDGVMLPLVREKPIGMSDDGWHHLCSIHFGLIVFATPKSPGTKALPEIIANGDLDGDYYLILWDKVILSCICDDKMFAIESESEDDYSEDPLIGQSVEREVCGRLHHGVVKKRSGEDDYIVIFESLEDQVMTKKEIVGDREFFVGISNHRGQGPSIEVELSWETSDGIISKGWHGMDGALRRQANVAGGLAQYALDHDLLNAVGWRWASKLVWQADAVEIVDHRVLSQRDVEFQVLYEDSETNWEKLSMEEDCQMIREYAEKKDLLQKKSWSWLKPYITKAKGKWFDEMQHYLSNTQRLIDNDRLTTLLHRKFKKSHSGTDESIHFGRAYKQALDIGKHGGRVDLPIHLHSHITPKNLHKYLTFR